MALDKAPTYNLKSVLDETGIAADTLRAWERRYGLPMPQRTAGGHRLYSQQDIYMLKWLLRRRAEGLSISRAVKQWNAALASGQDPLAETLAQDQAGSEAALAVARREWLEACCNFDEAGAEQALDRAFAVHSVETVATAIILRGLREVGGGWQRQEVTVQQEHFTSVLATRCLHDLIAAAPYPFRPGTIVLACPPVERHSLPLLYLNLMLRRRGWNVIFLGADVPVEHLDDTTRRTNAALVVMGAQRLHTAAALRDAAALLAKRLIPVAYGGYIFNQLPALRQQIAGEFLGESVERSVDVIEKLMQSKVAVREQPPAAPNFSAQAYRTLRSEVDAAIRKRLAAQAEAYADLQIANSYFGSALSAALELGDIAYLASDMGWIRFLLTRPRLPFDSPRPYLEAYAAALRQVMGSTGIEIADWLDRYAASL